jgi:nucleotide-binding universal stress UspA family protein
VYIERPGTKRRPLIEVLRDDAERDMTDFLTKTELGPGIRCGKHLANGEPAAAILGRVEKGGYDLIVIGTSGRSGVRQLLLGSVAARLIRLSPVPVITIPPQRES